MKRLSGNLLFVAAVAGSLSAAIAQVWASTTVTEKAEKAEVIHSWTRMNWLWPNEAAKNAYNDNQVYKAATLAGVDADRNDNLYVTTPRWINAAVPSTLNKVQKVNGESVLVPFPSWEQNRVGNARDFQNALGLEVDSKNRMWIVDMGWVAGIDNTPDGAQKIVVLDLNSGKELKRYPIPDSVADRKTSFLNDIVVDEKREIAFVSDSGNRSGSPTASGIIVYDFKTNTARRILDRHPSTQDDPSRELKVMGERVLPNGRLAVGINGLTLSADGSTLRWVVTTGDAIYSAKVDTLLKPNASAAELNAAISEPLRIGGGGDGMTMDARGRIYVTHLTDGKVQRYVPNSTLQSVASGSGMEWPDSLSWDSKGGLLVSTNWLNRAFAGQMNFDQTNPNYRIWRIQTDSSKGYVK